MFNTILVYPLLNVLIFIYAVLPGHDYGLAIIVLTAIIRFILWPLVGRQLHSQKKLQELQPEITRIRKQAGGDKQKESQLMMELYKEKEVNPFSSCLPLIIQLPFLFALFIVFERASKSFHEIGTHLYPFVQHLDFIKHLMANPNVFHPTLLGLVNMAKPNWILALLAGVVQFIQAKQIQPKPAGEIDKQTQLTNSMTLLFPVVTVIIAIRLPSALSLYWITTTLIAIFQQWLIIRSETEKMEEVKVTKRVKS